VLHGREDVSADMPPLDLVITFNTFPSMRIKYREKCTNTVYSCNFICKICSAAIWFSIACDLRIIFVCDLRIIFVDFLTNSSFIGRQNFGLWTYLLFYRTALFPLNNRKDMRIITNKFLSETSTLLALNFCLYAEWLVLPLKLQEHIRNISTSFIWFSFKYWTISLIFHNSLYSMIEKQLKLQLVSVKVISCSDASAFHLSRRNVLIRRKYIGSPWLNVINELK